MGSTVNKYCIEQDVMGNQLCCYNQINTSDNFVIATYCTDWGTELTMSVYLQLNYLTYVGLGKNNLEIFASDTFGYFPLC